MSKGLKRFFIICAAFVVVGAVLSIAGYAMGGIAEMSKVDEKYKWFSGGSTERSYKYLPAGAEFDTVNVTGDINVFIRTGQTNDTRIGFAVNSAEPAFSVEGGVLNVTAGEMDSGVINLSFDDRKPTLEVYIPAGQKIKAVNADIDGDMTIETISADTIKINDDNGDIYFVGTASEDINVAAGYGDISGTNMKCQKLYVKTENGDAELEGRFAEKTDIDSEYGDVDIKD